MRKQSFTVRCDGDGCQTLVDVDDLKHLPAGWYEVGIGDANGRIQTGSLFDFCSLRCVEKWAKARRSAIGETSASKQGYERTKKCPYCEEMFSPQGLTLHVRSNHAEEVALDQATAP